MNSPLLTPVCAAAVAVIEPVTEPVTTNVAPLVISTFSFQLTTTVAVSPWSYDAALNHTPVIVASAIAVARLVAEPTATRTSSKFLEPTVFFNTQPSAFAIVLFLV